MEKYQISIIIPLYNRSDFIVKCLDSLANQTLSQDLFEVIVIDDASTDNSLDIVRAYKKLKHLKIIPLSENSGGASKPRNIGIDEALGKYIFFLDSDDFITDKALELGLNLAIKEDLDMVIVPILFHEKRKPYTPLFENYSEGITKVDLTEENSVITRTIFTIPGIIGRLYRANLLKESGIRFSEKMRTFEDTLFAKFVCCLYKTAGVLPVNSAYYYPYPATSKANLSTLKRTVERCKDYLVEAIRISGDISNRFLSEDQKIYIINHSICRNNIFDVLNNNEGYKALVPDVKLLLPYYYHPKIREKAKVFIGHVCNVATLNENIEQARTYFLAHNIELSKFIHKIWVWDNKTIVIDFKIKNIRFGIDISSVENGFQLISLVPRAEASKYLNDWSSLGTRVENKIHLFYHSSSKGFDSVLSDIATVIHKLHLKV